MGWFFKGALLVDNQFAYRHAACSVHFQHSQDTRVADLTHYGRYVALPCPFPTDIVVNLVVTAWLWLCVREQLHRNHRIRLVK
jgi:hypothetical protein